MSSDRLYRPDTSKIFVQVGLGFHVEFTLPEALAFIDKKEEHLMKYAWTALLSSTAAYTRVRQAEAFSQRAAEIKSKIKIVQRRWGFFLFPFPSRLHVRRRSHSLQFYEGLNQLLSLPEPRRRP